MSNRALETFDLTDLPGDVMPLAATDHDPDRAYRRQAAVTAFSRRAVAPPNLRLLIQDAAALVAETLSVERFGLAELSDDRAELAIRLGNVAAFEDVGACEMPPAAMLERQLSLDPSSSLAAYAMHANEVVAVADLTAEHRFADRWLAEQGVRAAVVVPLQFRDQPYGVLGAFSSRPQQFPRDDLMYAEMIAHLVSTNIARDQTSKILESERRFTTTVLETVDAIVLVVTPAGRIVRINSACEQVTGFACDEVRDRPIWSALLVPGEATALKDVFARLKAGAEPVDHESFLLTKHAVRRRIQWSFAVLTQSGDSVETILATGIDITERRAAEEEVGRLRAEEAESHRRLQAVLEELETQKTAAAQATAASNIAAPETAAPNTAASDVEAAGWGSESSPFHPVPRSTRGDRRKRPRRTFAYYQRIAPTIDGRIPPLRMFRRVQCLDISAGGFSFLSSVMPTDTDYVVALGNPPVVIHVAAKVAHVTQTDYEGQLMYLVGCAYTGRVDY
jgi:PAS domain S-box-containing protein